MIHCGTHDDYDDPPHVQMITGMLPKRPKKESMSDVLAAAATAVANTFTLPSQAAVKLPNSKQYASSWHFTG